MKWLFEKTKQSNTIKEGATKGAGATFDLTFFDNSKLINFDD